MCYSKNVQTLLLLFKSQNYIDLNLLDVYANAFNTPKGYSLLLDFYRNAKVSLQITEARLTSINFKLQEYNNFEFIHTNINSNNFF